MTLKLGITIDKELINTQELLTLIIDVYSITNNSINDNPLAIGCILEIANTEFSYIGEIYESDNGVSQNKIKKYIII